MLSKYLTAIILMMTTSLTAYAQTAKTLCPRVLNASGVNTGLSPENLSALYETMDSSGTFKVLSEQDVSTVLVEPAKNSSSYKIEIEEIKASGSASVKKISVVCPIVRDWQITAIPNVDLIKPSQVKDEVEAEVFGKPSFASRSGVRLVKLFHDSDDFVSINLFWNVDSQESIVPENLPKFLTSSKTSILHPKLLDDKYPVRGIRISATKTFGNVWYLLTKRSLETMGKLEFLTNPSDSISTRASFEELAKNSATLESLEFYDSVNGKFIPCNQVLAKDYDANCYNFNSQLNPNLWKTLRAGEAFYAQMILPLDKGYLIQTYEIGGGEASTPKLIEQNYEPNLLKLKIPSDSF